MVYEYLVVGIQHTSTFNPWPVDEKGILKKPTEKLNEFAKEGWELISVCAAGNNDREVCFFRRKI